MDNFKANETVAAVEAYGKGAKAINGYIKSTLSAYAKASVRLHFAACIGLFHASETGDVRPLNDFFSGLRKNDQDALRVWVGKLCVFDVEDPNDGNVTEKYFINFRKDKNFTVVKGTEEVRVGFFKLDWLMDQKSFQDVDQAKEKGVLDLAALLALLAKVEAQTVKKAEENGVPLPASLVAALHDLTGVVAKESVAAQAVAAVKYQPLH